jgi:hypothetical protein
MQIKFTLSVDDKIAFARLHLEHSPKQKKAIRANQLAFTVGTLVIAVVSFFFKMPEVSWGALIAALIVLAFFPWHHQRLVMKNTTAALRKQVPEGFVDTIEMSADESGLTVRDGKTTLTAAWTGILKSERTDRYSFIYLKGGNALIIPRGSVVEGDYEAFVAEIAERRKQHSI